MTATTNSKFELSDERYLLALRRMVERIASGLPLKAIDSEEIGNKFVDCPWGMCSMDASMWPAEDRFHPEPYSDGRVGAKHLSATQLCPMDKREKKTMWGCSYHCRIFQHRKSERPTREQAIELYQLMIAKVTA